MVFIARLCLALIIHATSCTLRGVNNPPIMLNLGCQPYSLYREDFSVHRLKLFGSIYVAYGFYSQTLAGYNKKEDGLDTIFFFKSDS